MPQDRIFDQPGETGRRVPANSPQPDLSGKVFQNEKLMKKARKEIVPLSYPVYYATVLALVLCGFVVSAYLSYSHYLNYTDITYQSFCAISNAINCDTVSQSVYSIFIGLPVPVWGVIGYTFLLCLVILAWRREAMEARIWALILWVALFFVLASLALAAVSTFLIHSYCIMCIGIYLVSFFTLWFVWLIRSRFAVRGLFTDTIFDLKYLGTMKRLVFPLLAIMLTGIGLTYALMPPYWHMKPPKLSQAIPSGKTEQGYPWMGAEHPAVEVEVFSDYQCFQCKKMHMYLRQLLERYPHRLRIVQRHYPMDHKVNPIVKTPFHRGSGKMALMAIYAAENDKFWVMNDILFQLAGRENTIDLKYLAQRTGLEAIGLYKAIKDPDTRRKLNRDLRDGINYGIDGTPSFVIDGKLYSGVIPPEIIHPILRSPSAGQTD
jgi:uncharacterized membrane protein/protein-disulfide isomerase